MWPVEWLTNIEAKKQCSGAIQWTTVNKPHKPVITVDKILTAQYKLSCQNLVAFGYMLWMPILCKSNAQNFTNILWDI